MLNQSWEIIIDLQVRDVTEYRQGRPPLPGFGQGSDCSLKFCGKFSIRIALVGEKQVIVQIPAGGPDRMGPGQDCA